MVEYLGEILTVIATLLTAVGWFEARFRHIRDINAHQDTSISNLTIQNKTLELELDRRRKDDKELFERVARLETEIKIAVALQNRSHNERAGDR